MQNRTMYLVAGVDEAGRGPLAGPVTAAAVILDPDQPIAGLADSKALSAQQRERLADAVRVRAHAFALGWASVEEIDTLNILQASLLAMSRAVAALTVQPHHVQVDGNQRPVLTCSVEAIVRGDSTVAAISAASILAKVERDAFMLRLHAQFPEYGFARHKGYPSPFHIDRLRALGPSPWHRRSFAPVRAVLQEN